MILVTVKLNSQATSFAALDNEVDAIAAACHLRLYAIATTDKFVEDLQLKAGFAALTRAWTFLTSWRKGCLKWLMTLPLRESSRNSVSGGRTPLRRYAFAGPAGRELEGARAPLGEARVRCAKCRDSGWVCEEHPDRPSDIVTEGGCDCGGAAAPCICNPDAIFEG